MTGVEFRTAGEAGEVQRQAFERGLLVPEGGESSIQISPLLVVSRRQASTGLRLLGEAMHAARQLTQVGSCPSLWNSRGCPAPGRGA
jgi:4-aminobutyrate aminotransferase-like enzyme